MATKRQNKLLRDLLKSFMWARNELRKVENHPSGIDVWDGDGAILKDEIKIYRRQIEETFGAEIKFDEEMEKIFTTLR